MQHHVKVEVHDEIFWFIPYLYDKIMECYGKRIKKETLFDVIFVILKLFCRKFSIDNSRNI